MRWVLYLCFTVLSINVLGVAYGDDSSSAIPADKSEIRQIIREVLSNHQELGMNALAKECLKHLNLSVTDHNVKVMRERIGSSRYENGYSLRGYVHTSYRWHKDGWCWADENGKRTADIAEASILSLSEEKETAFKGNPKEFHNRVRSLLREVIPLGEKRDVSELVTEIGKEINLEDDQLPFLQVEILRSNGSLENEVLDEFRVVHDNQAILRVNPVVRQEEIQNRAEQSALRNRLVKLIQREGNEYVVTSGGIQRINGYSDLYDRMFSTLKQFNQIDGVPVPEYVVLSFEKEFKALQNKGAQLTAEDEEYQRIRDKINEDKIRLESAIFNATFPYYTETLSPPFTDRKRKK